MVSTHVILRKDELDRDRVLAEYIRASYRPKSILNVGCGASVHVDAMASGRGSEDETAVKLLPLDLGEAFPSSLHDLVISLEVGEYIAEDQAHSYVAYLAGANADTIIFAAAQPGQGAHVNAQPKAYWQKKIESQGYHLDIAHTARMLAHLVRSCHMGWFRVNAMVFRRAELATEVVPASRPNLHMIGLFHTAPKLSYSHCAFTGKVLRFSKMMQAQGWDVIEYANGESESDAINKVKILAESELDHLKAIWLRAKADVGAETPELKGDDHARALVSRAEALAAQDEPVEASESFHGDTAAIGSPHWRRFEEILWFELQARVRPGDIICHPFGRSHVGLVKGFPDQIHVETGIGYMDEPFGAYRIFETYNWMAYHQGRDKRNGSDYEYVVPNYFDLDEWPTDEREINDGYLLYFGRVNKGKGMSIIKAMAEVLDEDILVVGQGELGEFEHPRLKKLPPVTGQERAKLLQGARALLMPTRFVEPFGGAGVEGQLVGTPLIASNFGAFAETIEQGTTGFRCHTLGDWVEATKAVRQLDRATVARKSRAKYNLETCGRRYDQILKQLADTKNGNNGWHHLEARIPVF